MLLCGTPVEAVRNIGGSDHFLHPPDALHVEAAPEAMAEEFGSGLPCVDGTALVGQQHHFLRLVNLSWSKALTLQSGGDGA